VPQESYDKISLVKKPLAIIATYHSDHTRIASEIFNINPSTLLFIEKPPCVTLDDISTLVGLYQKGAKIEIGYNRRFIPINQEIKRKLKGQKAVINISIKEILINDNHWYFWENQGTRITGNLTHWIDICNFWLEDEIPIELNMLKSTSKDETFSVSILYSNGSLANITVSDKGNSLRGVQEKIEIRTEHETYHIDDYLKMCFIGQNGKKIHKNRIKRIKGHDEMYKHVVNLHRDKAKFRYTVQDLIKTALTTYYLSEMFRNNTKNFKIKDAIAFMLDKIKEN
jgi:predicted dehydrogenase